MMENEGQDADFLIECPAGIFSVHKTVVCPQCNFMENACKNEWKKINVQQVLMIMPFGR